MKISTRITLIVFVAFLAGIFYWAIFSPKPQISERIYKTLKEQEARADLAFKDVTFKEIDNGIKYWELQAVNATVNKSSQVATLQTAKGTFFKKGKPVLRFRSPAALWDMKEKEILLDKPLGYDVKLDRKISSLLQGLKKSRFSIFNLPKLYRKGLGYWFQAKNLSWKLADQQLVCTGGILLNKGNITGFAQKLEADVALEKILLRGKPKVVISPEDSAPITFEADAIEVISEKDIILARGSPRITWRNARIYADDLKYFQAEDRLELSGRVRIKYDDIEAWGNTASYLTEDARIILAGQARAKQLANELSGNKVNVLLQEKKISVMGKGKVVITEDELK